jgi:hypothetical protein
MVQILETDGLLYAQAGDVVATAQLIALASSGKMSSTLVKVVGART